MKNVINLSHISAGFIAMLVGYTSSVAIIFQATETVGASAEEVSSWLWALGIGMGLTSIGLSLFYRAPTLTAWSTPGAALLVTGLSGYSLPEAVGIFIFSSSLMLICGLTGVFNRIVAMIPPSLASAMLAGILLEFGLALFIQLETQRLLVALMLSTYVVSKLIIPRYTIPTTLAIGVLVASLEGQLDIDALVWEMSRPIWVTPEFSIAGIIGVGIPLFIVTMASQNLPGIAVIRASGYQTPVSPLISWTGFAGVVLAPFGGFAFNLAAITAAICLGKEAGADPEKRYFAAIWAGMFYVLTGIFGATVASLFAMFPTALVVAIAGLALLGTISASLTSSMSEEKEREAALITLLATASGISIAGIGSAFWGILLGMSVIWLQRLLKSR